MCRLWSVLVIVVMTLEQGHVQVTAAVQEGGYTHVSVWNHLLCLTTGLTGNHTLTDGCAAVGMKIYK
uniref:Uncharacterized protein n=1 Tax=Ditylenchus dipsaci TaxID=166011 RepID=A0A915DR46_9BILA